MIRYICFFHEPRAAELAEVGGKGSNLGKLTAAGFPIPPGFCVTAAAYRYLLEITGLDDVISRKLAKLDFQAPGSVARAAGEIRKLIISQPIPSDIAQQIETAYDALGHAVRNNSKRPLAVAVRSSATAEDLPEASFAGQQDTFLNICGHASVLEHIRHCWASLWTDRALTYRQKQGYDHRRVNLAVVVQAMVDSQAAGVIFTSNPMTGNRSQCVVNASWGLGEAIVSGLVSPDTYIVAKADGRILEQHSPSKERMIVASSGGGAIEVETENRKRDIPVLDGRQIAALTALASRIEEHFACPQDIEWAYRDKWYILQARPITSLPEEQPAAGAAECYSRAMFVEIFPEAISPAFISVVTPLLSSMLQFTFRTLGLKPPDDMIPVRDFYNQPYFNATYIRAAFAQLPEGDRRRLTAQFVNPIAYKEENGHVSPTQLKLLARLLRFWWGFKRQLPDLLNAFRSEVSSLESLPLDSIPDEELTARLRHMVFDGASRLLNGDFLLIALSGTFNRLLLRQLEHHFADDAPRILNGLISAVSGNIIMETNALLWNLAQETRQKASVKGLLMETRGSDCLTQLGETDEGRHFLRQLQGILDVCGHRENHLDILYPTWGEDPAPVLAYIRTYMTAGADQDPAARTRQSVREREQLTNRVLTRISRRPTGRYFIAPLFRWALGQLHQLLRERDTMHYEWTRLFPPARRLLLELGRRWSEQHLLDSAADIFYLRLEEMEALTRQAAPQQERVTRRRAQLAENLHGPWPDIIDDGHEIFGEATKRKNGLLRGVAGSPGKATGACRIVRSPAEFNRLRAGEILIAPLTNPVWTPLFAIAGGLVTNVGGILSHGAIVAREYGIPAVMSVTGATEHLVDGQVVTVDGNKGTVTILPAGSSPHV